MKRISIKDIAKIAGVAPSTVSSVLNNKEKEARISTKLVEKIRKISKELGYQPNSTAVSLRTGKTQIIGLIIEDISNPFFASLAKKLEDSIQKHKYRILYCSTENDDDNGAALVRMLFHRQVDGFIIAPTAGMKNSLIELSQSNKPLVLVDRYFPDLSIPSVLVDNFMGTTKSMDLLWKKGYRNIGFITTDAKQLHMQQREDAYRGSLTKLGVPVNEKIILRVPFNSTQEEKVRKIMSFLKKNPGLDALIFSTNYLGIAGLEAIKACGLRIPENIAVISFDELDIFRLYTPGITTISQPIGKIAKEAIRLLFNQINSEQELRTEKAPYFLAPDIILRDSV
jgi:LacI family transcriptional regulator